MKENRLLKAAIFDLGGVIFGISLDPVIDYWAKCAGVNPQDIAAKFKIDSYYKRFEVGEIPPGEYRNHVRSLMGIHLSDENFDRGWNSIYLDVLPGIETLLKQLQNSLRLVVLTNTNHIHEKEWRVRYSDILKKFEKVFASHEIGARKPDPESFQIVLDYLGIEPGKAVFIDDNPENVRGAELVGIRSILATTASEIAQKLQIKINA